MANCKGVYNLTRKDMPNGALLGGMSVDFVNLILIINVFAIAVLAGVLYAEDIVAGWNRVIKTFNPLNMRARIRMWRTAHRLPH
jgi:hypothetical protein